MAKTASMSGKVGAWVHQWRYGKLISFTDCLRNGRINWTRQGDCKGSSRTRCVNRSEDARTDTHSSLGAHVTIFARRQKPLEEAKEEILATRQNESQEVKAVSVDLSDGAKVGLELPV